MLTTTKRNYVKKAIQIQSAKSYSSMARLEFALRGYGLQFAKHIIMQNGGRYIPIFQADGMITQDREIAEFYNFRVV